MRLFSTILLILFITFLSTPTVVSLIEKNTDISLFYSFAEEETNKDFKELKADFYFEFISNVTNFQLIKNSEIISKNLSKHDKVLDKIFTPPPELI